MQFQNRISAIERRAQSLRLTLASVCRSADVPYATMWRLRTGRVARPRKAALYLKKLEAEIERQRRVLRRRLAS